VDDYLVPLETEASVPAVAHVAGVIAAAPVGPPVVAEGPGEFHIERLSSTCPAWYDEMTSQTVLPGQVSVLEGELVVQVSNWPLLTGPLDDAFPTLAGQLVFYEQVSKAGVLCELTADVDLTTGALSAKIVETMTSEGALNCNMVERITFHPER